MPIYGKEIFAALSSLQRPASLNEILVFVAKQRRVTPQTIQAELNKTIGVGLQYGFIDEANNCYYCANLMAESLSMEDPDVVRSADITSLMSADCRIDEPLMDDVFLVENTPEFKVRSEEIFSDVEENYDYNPNSRLMDDVGVVENGAENIGVDDNVVDEVSIGDADLGLPETRYMLTEAMHTLPTRYTLPNGDKLNSLRNIGISKTKSTIYKEQPNKKAHVTYGKDVHCGSEDNPRPSNVKNRAEQMRSKSTTSTNKRKNLERSRSQSKGRHR